MCVPSTQQRHGVKNGMLVVIFEYAVLAGGGGRGGGAVFLGIGGRDTSTTLNTTVALTNCTMTNNKATGSCLE
jgi:hypothetical protein